MQLHEAIPRVLLDKMRQPPTDGKMCGYYHRIALWPQRVKKEAPYGPPTEEDARPSHATRPDPPRARRSKRREHRLRQGPAHRRGRLEDALPACHARGFLGLDERHFLIPIEAVSYVGGGFVKTKLSKEQVHGSPELDPNIRLHPELRAEIYEYYGYPTPG